MEISKKPNVCVVLYTSSIVSKQISYDHKIKKVLYVNRENSTLTNVHRYIIYLYSSHNLQSEMEVCIYLSKFFGALRSKFIGDMAI